MADRVLPVRSPVARRRSAPRRPAGFNLIELMIAIMILGILAGLAYGAYDRYREKARVNQAVIDIGAMATAIKLHAEDTRSYPDSLAEAGFGTRLDPWGRPYQYRYPGQHNKDKYDIWSSGKDGQDGTADDIGNW